MVGGQNWSFDKTPMVNLDSGRSGNRLLAVGNRLLVRKMSSWMFFVSITDYTLSITDYHYMCGKFQN